MLLKTFAFRILVLIAFSIITSEKIEAQSAGQIPPFKMLMSDGKFFSATDLPKERPVVLIYFAPDCEHCQVLMNEFFKNIDAFKTVQIVLVTYKPVQELLAFENLYETNKYQNIKAGTEGNTYFLRRFFKLDTTPFTALYNKEGKLVCSYRKETPVDDLINHVKQL